MRAPLSPDIRNGFHVLHRAGLSAREIGRCLLIFAATAVRFADRLRRTGDLTPATHSRCQGHGRLVVSLQSITLRRFLCGGWLSKILISR